jgi:phosphocarrier protein
MIDLACFLLYRSHNIHYTFLREIRYIFIPKLQSSVGERRKNMKIVTVTVNDPLGLHARPSSLLTKLAKEFNCQITVYKNEDSSGRCNVKNVLSVMDLNGLFGDKLTFEAIGDDERKAIAAIEAFANNGFEN